MIQVFCSFTSQDRKLVEKATNILEFDDTIECWLFTEDGSITQRNISVEIKRKIQAAEYFIFFWSEAYSRKPWHEREIEAALEWETKLKNDGRGDDFIIVVRLDNTELPELLDASKYWEYSESTFHDLRTEIQEHVQDRLAHQNATNTPPLLQTIGEVASEPLRIDPKTSVSKAYVYMQTNHKRHAIVEQNGKISGRIALRDIIEILPPPYSEVSSALSFEQYTYFFEQQSDKVVEEIMIHFGSDMLFLRPEQTILEGLNYLVNKHRFGDMERRVSAVAVVEDDEAVGMIEYADLLCNLECPRKRVSDICRPRDKVITVYAYESVTDAYEWMLSQHVRHLPVVDAADRFLGMLEDVYLVEYIKAEKSFNIIQDKSVSDIMKPSNEIPMITQDTPLDRVIPLFCNNANTRCLPVRQGEKLTGILSFVDILNAMKSLYESKAATGNSKGRKRK